MVTLFALLLVATAIVVDIMLTKFLWRLSQRPRFRPTKFCYNGVPAQIVFPAPAKPFRHLDPETLNIDDRYEFVRPLGSGCEGRTAIYRDTHRRDQLVVIKSFFPGVRTNPIPEHLKGHFHGEGWSPRSSWPSEIPSTLYFSNVYAPGDFHDRDDGRRLNGRFIYALDYFWVKPGKWWAGSGHGSGGWKLVTPFLSNGTMETLANLIRHRRMRPADIDAIYRRRYRKVLEALAEMHELGYSHDDVKLDNIFISPTNSFLLGDLGNVREHGHEFHLSHRCDFQRNDVERAIRSYLTFLRLASGERAWFDQEFHAGNAEWSDFYWRYKCNPKSAKELLKDDNFWAKHGGSHAVVCDIFEAEINRMRLEQKQWKLGFEGKPAWFRDQTVYPQALPSTQGNEDVGNLNLMECSEGHVGIAEGTFFGRVKWIPDEKRQKAMAKQVDGELACVTLNIFEKLLLGQPKPGFSQSSY